LREIAMPPQRSVDRQAFLANLLESGLLSAEQLAALADQLPDTHRARLVARALVRRGILTKFQAERLLVGRTSGFVLGQYRILDELGRGGMGRVYKAVHQTLNRTVALKVLAPQLLETEKAQELFLREMQTVARLMHPNIVTAYDANQLGDRYYLVMEYVDGPNLDRLVRKRGPLPVGLACELIRQTAEGLQYAADMGMVHRDIKPSNLLLALPGSEPQRKHGTVKILDFGLARLQSPGADATAKLDTIITRPNMLMGTPDFVSPEQARDLHTADIRSDLYSLGCTFYFLLTGQVPFPDGSTLEKMVRHATQEPVPVEKLRAEIPMGVAAIVGRLMAKDPAGRFQTPAELALALAPLAAEGPTPWPAPAQVSYADVDLVLAPDAEDSSTPSTGSDSNFDFPSPVIRGDSLAGLKSTVPPDLAPTLLSNPGFSPRGRNRWAQADRRRVAVALAVAIGVVAGITGFISLLYLL
jgi:serine/threonine-protein kinase